MQIVLVCVCKCACWHGCTHLGDQVFSFVFNSKITCVRLACSNALSPLRAPHLSLTQSAHYLLMFPVNSVYLSILQVGFFCNTHNYKYLFNISINRLTMSWGLEYSLIAHCYISRVAWVVGSSVFVDRKEGRKESGRLHCSDIGLKSFECSFYHSSFSCIGKILYTVLPKTLISHYFLQMLKYFEVWKHSKKGKKYIFTVGVYHIWIC